MKSSDLLLIERMTREMQLRNYSAKSIRTYTSLLSKIVNYFDIPLDQINSDQIKDFLHHRVVVEKVSTSTVNQTISAFKILQEDVLSRKWDAIKIKRPRLNKKLPVVLSLEEVEKLISILSVKALELLRAYYKSDRPSVYLFETSREKGKYLSQSSLDAIIKNSSKKAGITKVISFHTLRHSFATHLLEQGVNIKLIQKLLGHNSIRTTMIYLHIANVEPGTIVSPLDDMDIN